MAYTLVLLRHGESVWNKANLFTGWTDVPLSEKGVEEAREGGRLLKESGYTFDAVHAWLQVRSRFGGNGAFLVAGDPPLAAQ